MFSLYLHAFCSRIMVRFVFKYSKLQNFRLASDSVRFPDYTKRIWHLLLAYAATPSLEARVNPVCLNARAANHRASKCSHISFLHMPSNRIHLKNKRKSEERPSLKMQPIKC